MSIILEIRKTVVVALKELYDEEVKETDLIINQTNPEFEGDYTVVLFSLVKKLKKNPELVGKELGELLIGRNLLLFESFNVIKGFLSLTVSDRYWIEYLKNNFSNKKLTGANTNPQKVIVEYSSPNTNKPLHLGHLRNNFLGWSVARILEERGHEVIKTCIVNDRGIHICKSMIAWQRFGNGETPVTTNTKGDHFVGRYYVRFNEELKKQVNELVEGGMKKEDAEKQAPIMNDAQQMLQDWEKGDAKVLDLWRKMNGWVYGGFDLTYKRIGSDFHKMYYESETYLPGKKFVEEGLSQGVFFKKEDGSVWVDLTAEGLDEKLLLRKDGTSVYITQDLGLAQQKYDEYKYDQSIYVIADEQNYHMKVLKLILQKLGKAYAEGIYHLSYGMVELPSGRMKSREGTVVDADEMIEEMVSVARSKTEVLGKVKDFNNDELRELYDTLALGAIKFFLLRVDPKKRMVFNPEESIDFHGFTGPFVQYTHARIKSILRKSEAASQKSEIGDQDPETGEDKEAAPLLKLEKDLLILLEQYPVVIEEAEHEHNPSVIAIYVFNLAKQFNSFYTEHSVMNAETLQKKKLRLRLCEMTANVIQNGMELMGIRVPERM